MAAIENGKLTAIPTHFGDIMSLKETEITLPDSFAPLERIVLTANGNLQRIISAYYNARVTVDILKNIQVDEDTFDREVNLSCLGQVFCNAKSKVTVTNKTYLDLVVSQAVGIGQLFRYLHRLPEFTLLNVGKTDGALWRLYRLQTEGITCEIREEFPSNLFSLASC